MSVTFPFSILLAFLSLLENVHRSPFIGSVKGALKCVSWHGLACQQEFGRTRRHYTIQTQPMNLHTPGSTVHLTCRSWRRRSSWFNYAFFLFLTSSHHSRSLRGAERSKRSLYSGSGLATRSSGLQKNSYSLWHMLRRSIISLSLLYSPMLSLPRSLLSDLSSRGLVKLPGKNNSKHWTGPMSPVSHKPLQTF